VDVDHAFAEGKLDETIPTIILVDPDLSNVFALAVWTL
jgi:hypothetical protein